MSLVFRVLRRVPRNKHVSRSFAMKNREEDFMKSEPIPPGHTLDAVQAPEYFSMAPSTIKLDPMAHVRQPVTSAHMILDNAVSARDSVSVGPSGSIVHGRFGDLGVQDGIPLEYLALLRPAAEGAAACEKLGNNGTLLVFGATQAAGLAATQMWKGKAVCAVVGGEHSGIDEMMGIVKGLTNEPGFAVAEEYALLKKNFSDMVSTTVNGEKIGASDPDAYLSDFKANLLDYSVAFPETLPAAVGESHLDFGGKKEKDREHFRDNMDPYLAQYPSGSPPLDPTKVETYFNVEQYTAFKAKFGVQTTAVITGDDVGDFAPAQIASDMIQSPEAAPKATGGEIPFQFSILGDISIDVPSEGAGPVAGAVIAVTPDLEAAAIAMDAAKSLRAKAEALQFLTDAQQNAYAAATAVVREATKVGAPVIVVGGSLPGFESIEPTDNDVQEALAAMELEEDGSSRLNYFIQVFRSGDYPIYEDYAVHRNAEGSPYQIIVTK